MTIVKSQLIEKVINNNVIRSPEIVVMSNTEYKTIGESYLIIRDAISSKVLLDSQTTNHITIKALTRVLIIPDIGRIDDEFDEILIDKGACVEFYFALGIWYILSSDGLKNS